MLCQKRILRQWSIDLILFFGCFRWIVQFFYSADPRCGKRKLFWVLFEVCGVSKQAIPNCSGSTVTEAKWQTTQREGASGKGLQGLIWWGLCLMGKWKTELSFSVWHIDVKEMIGLSMYSVQDLVFDSDTVRLFCLFVSNFFSIFVVNNFPKVWMFWTDFGLSVRRQYDRIFFGSLVLVAVSWVFWTLYRLQLRSWNMRQAFNPELRWKCTLKNCVFFFFQSTQHVRNLCPLSMTLTPWNSEPIHNLTRMAISLCFMHVTKG